MEKAKQHAKKVDYKVISEAGFVDFSKSIDDQDQRDDIPDDDPRKSVMKFPTPCYNCDKTGNV